MLFHWLGPTNLKFRKELEQRSLTRSSQSADRRKSSDETGASQTINPYCSISDWGHIPSQTHRQRLVIAARSTEDGTLSESHQVSSWRLVECRGWAADLVTPVGSVLILSWKQQRPTSLVHLSHGLSQIPSHGGSTLNYTRRRYPYNGLLRGFTTFRTLLIQGLQSLRYFVHVEAEAEYLLIFLCRP